MALSSIALPSRACGLPLHGRRGVSVRGLGERRELGWRGGIRIILDQYALVAQTEHGNRVPEVLGERTRREPECRMPPAGDAGLAPV
jgi:hypothetical protein